MLDATKIPKLENGFRFQWEDAQQCHVLLYPEGMIKLNPAAGEILQLVDSNKNVNDIVSSLMDKFGGDASIEKDVHAFVEEAIENKWINLS